MTITFDIPEHGNDPSELGLDLRLEALEQWLRHLPLANADVASGQVLDKLSQLNTARAEPLLRFRWLQRLQPVAEDLLHTVHGKFAHALLPLTTRTLNSFERSLDLNDRIATGFKIVVHDLLQEQGEGRKSGRVVLTCLYMAMHHYSLGLLDAYSVYFPEPVGLWRELHRLYRFAERYGVGDTPVLQQHTDSQPCTVSLAYRRAALLAAANPYHLMQDEARAVFRLLYKLSAGCRLLDTDGDAHTPCYYVDLEGDAPPRFALDSGDLSRAAEPRLLELGQLLAALDKRIGLLSDATADPAAHNMSPLARRLQRNMLKRLAGAWGRDSERAHERHTTLGQAKLCIGLRAAHKLLNGNGPFHPELDEVKIHTGYTPEAAPEPKAELSLLPTDLEPWKMEEHQEHVHSSHQTGRVSQFAGRRAADVWEKIYATKVPTQTQQLQDSAPTPTLWNLQNISARGFSVACAASNGLAARVGEIVAYQLTGEGRDENWRIGCVRWLRVTENSSMELGVMQVDGSATPTATRAIKGVGHGGEYFRSLIVPAVELMADAATLIVPAAIFDVGSLLAVNTGHEIHYVRLTRIVDATKSYSQFHFTITKQPASETKNIMSMRAML